MLDSYIMKTTELLETIFFHLFGINFRGIGYIIIDFSIVFLFWIDTNGD